MSQGQIKRGDRVSAVIAKRQALALLIDEFFLYGFY
jgi:hypothetical protein